MRVVDSSVAGPSIRYTEEVSALYQLNRDMGKRSPRALTIGRVLPANRKRGNLSARCHVDYLHENLALFSLFFRGVDVHAF